jgi:CTP:molybdopterin cytidylyltransferase MocA
VTTAAVLLAAGGGTRFAGPDHKLRTSFRGRPLITWAVDAAVGAGLDEVAVVVGAVALADLLPPDVVLVANPAWPSGQASSLQAAVGWAAGRGHEAVVIGLGDQPLVPVGAWSAVAASPSPVAVAVFGGRRRPPVRLHHSVWDLLPTDGDEGARVLMAARPDLVAEVECEGDPVDIDHAADLHRFT